MITQIQQMSLKMPPYAQLVAMPSGFTNAQIFSTMNSNMTSIPQMRVALVPFLPPTIPIALRYSDLKEAASVALVSFFTPIQEKYAEILAAKRSFKAQIQESSAGVRKDAAETMREVRDLTGVIPMK
jgi:hypothetical protein